MTTVGVVCKLTTELTEGESRVNAQVCSVDPELLFNLIELAMNSGQPFAAIAHVMRAATTMQHY